MTEATMEIVKEKTEKKPKEKKVRLLHDVFKLNQEQIESTKIVDREEALALVGMYFDMQKLRVGARNKEAAHERGSDLRADPLLITIMKERLREIEKQCEKSMQRYAESSLLGRWCMSHVGISHVLTSAFLAHLDVTHPGVKSAGSFMKFAGMIDPQLLKWGKGQRRPYNAALKQVCYLLGECLKKVSNHEGSFYGRMYKERKIKEDQWNAEGKNKERALAMLAEARAKGWRISEEQAEVWATGKIQKTGCDRRACRYAVCFFLSHYHHVAYEIAFGKPPAMPWIIAHGEHVGYVPPPGWPMVE